MTALSIFIMGIIGFFLLFILSLAFALWLSDKTQKSPAQKRANWVNDNYDWYIKNKRG
jgi:cbb3-type cytochrome oxidase subunit 3